MQFHRVATVVLACAVGFSAQGADQPKSYFAYDIGHLPLGYSVFPAAINDKGQIVGQADQGNGRVAFISNPLGKGIREIPSFAGDFYDSYAYDVNNKGEVVGVTTSASGGYWVAYITAPDGGAMRAVADIPVEGASSGATGITEDGRVIGAVQTNRANGFLWKAFISDPGALSKRWLGTASYNIFVAAGINKDGQVTGTMVNADREYVPYVTGPNGKGIHEMRSLPGLWTFPVAINDSGQVAGNVNYDGSYTINYPYLTGTNGRDPVALDIRPYEYAFANTMTANGQLAGTYRDSPNGFPKAFVTDAKGHLVDLAPLVVNLPQGTLLTAVTGVNRYGQMAVKGWGPNGQDIGYIICPTLNCEPAPRYTAD